MQENWMVSPLTIVPETQVTVFVLVAVWCGFAASAEVVRSVKLHCQPFVAVSDPPMVMMSVQLVEPEVTILPAAGQRAFAASRIGGKGGPAGDELARGDAGRVHQSNVGRHAQTGSGGANN